MCKLKFSLIPAFVSVLFGGLALMPAAYVHGDPGGYVVSQTCVNSSQVDVLFHAPPGAGFYSYLSHTSGLRVDFLNTPTAIARLPAGNNYSNAVWTWDVNYNATEIRYAYYSFTVRNDCTPPPTCSISLSPNPINRGSAATLSWSSSYATNYFYIANVGYVSGSGSTTVAPSTSTTYSGSVSGAGGSGSCSNTLTVRQSCSWNGGTITHGQSVTAYQNASLPYGSTCASQTRTCSNGTLSGSYAYASCTVSALPPPPTASISITPSIVRRAGTAVVSWTSNGADSCTVTGGRDSWTGTASPANGQATSPVQGEVTYTLRCQNAGGSVQASSTVRVLPEFQEV